MEMPEYMMRVPEGRDTSIRAKATGLEFRV